MSGASAAASSSMSVAKKSPSDYLKSLVGRPVVVRLTSGVDYRGEFSTFLYLLLISAVHGAQSYARSKHLPAAPPPLCDFCLAAPGALCETYLFLAAACARARARAHVPVPPLHSIPLHHAHATLPHHPYLTGILICLDGFMNVALEQTEEWTSGVLSAKFGDAFL